MMLKVNDFKKPEGLATYRKDKTPFKIDYN